MEQYLRIVTKARDEGGGLIEGFYALQNEYGYIPAASVDALAEAFDIRVAQVYETMSFYSYLNLYPVGKNMIRICKSAPCHVAGAQEVVEQLQRLLGISMGETTADGQFTLQYTECVGQCGQSPCITINRKPYHNVTPETLPSILAEYAEGRVHT